MKSKNSTFHESFTALIKNQEFLSFLARNTISTPSGKLYIAPIKLKDSFFSSLKSSFLVNLSQDVKEIVQSEFFKHKQNFVGIRQLLTKETLPDFYYLCIGLLFNSSKKSVDDNLLLWNIYLNDEISVHEYSKFINSLLGISPEKSILSPINGQYLATAIKMWKLNNFKNAYPISHYKKIVTRQASRQNSQKPSQKEEHKVSKSVGHKTKMQNLEKSILKIEQRLRIKKKTYESVFDEVDISRSGVVSLHKYQSKLLNNVGSTYSIELQNVIEFLDKNKDGKVSKDELIILVGDLKNLPEQPKPTTPIIKAEPTPPSNNLRISYQSPICRISQALQENNINVTDLYNQISKNKTSDVSRIILMKELRKILPPSLNECISDAVRQIGEENGYISESEFMSAFNDKPTQKINENIKLPTENNVTIMNLEAPEWIDDFWNIMDREGYGIDKMFCEIDSSRDGEISLAELRKWLNFTMEGIIPENLSKKIILHLKIESQGKPITFGVFSKCISKSQDKFSSKVFKSEIFTIQNENQPHLDLDSQRLHNQIKIVANELYNKVTIENKKLSDLLEAQNIRLLISRLNIKITEKEEEYFINMITNLKDNNKIDLKTLFDIANNNFNIPAALENMNINKKSLLFSALGNNNILISTYDKIKGNYYDKLLQYPLQQKDFYRKATFNKSILNSDRAALRYAAELTLNMQKNGKLLFEDIDFGSSTKDPTGGESIFLNKNDPRAKNIVWKRPNEISQHEKPEFFINGAKTSDVIQGEIQNCWFLAALALTAQDDKYLRGNFNPQQNLASTLQNNQVMGMLKGVYCPIFHHFRKYGLYVMRFFKNYRWRYVIIDDRLPCRETSNNEYELVFSRCRSRNEFWVPLIEKAYAKLHGSYEGLEFGNIDEALYDLTGLINEKIEFSKKQVFSKELGDYNTFWDSIIDSNKHYCLIGCSIRVSEQNETNETQNTIEYEDKEGNLTGLFKGHAYAILDVFEINNTKNTKKKHRLLRLLNPWGDKEWLGKWADDTNELTEKLSEINKSILKRRGEEAEEVVINNNDGIFFMNYKSWRDIFTHFFRANKFPEKWSGIRFKGEWNEKNSGGTPQTPKEIPMKSWEINPHFSIKLKSKGTIFISLGQSDPRLQCSENNKFPFKDKLNTIGFIIAKKQENELRLDSFRKERIVKITKFANQLTVHLRIILDPGEYFLIPSTLMKGSVGKFFINLYFDCEKSDIEIINIDNPIRQGSVIEEEEEAFQRKYDEDLKLILRMKASKAIFH